MSFERIGSETKWEGRIATVRVERFRHDDGAEVEREVIAHPGAVGVVAYDDEQVWLVRQPREAAGEQALLEVPAGKLDVEGEPPLQTARRELAEEIGKAAETWECVTDYVSSVGVMDEVVHVFLATGLSDAQAEAEHNERIEIVRWPLADLDGAIAATRDAKTLIGLLWLKARA
jgi:8-oxo-dGTP pyrophosphatase MutT (NUDIX family)